jgi:Protein of unknown function (DUF4242)
VEYVAECFWSGVTQADLAQLDSRARASAQEGGVRYLGSMLMPEDEVVFCFFDGTSHEAVESVATRAQIPFERIVESIRVTKEERL